MRNILEPYLDKLVIVKAMFDKSTNYKIRGMTIRTTLIQDATISIDSHEFDIGHLWVTHSGAFEQCPVMFGDRMEFVARVVKYWKDNDVAYGVAWPRNIEVKQP